MSKDDNQKRFFPKLSSKGVRSLKWPNWSQWKKITNLLGRKEKILLGFFLILILFSAYAAHLRNNYKNSDKAAASGGEYTEGMIGQPQYLNPALASASDIDSDITELLFSGLFKYSETGEFLNDLAKDYSISEDKKTYTVNLKDNVLWHDGEKLNSKDVVFTVQTIANPDYKSPLQQSLQSVECQAENDLSVSFILKEPYAPFLRNLTFKILPAHIWQSFSPANFQLASPNLKPTGSGIFQFKNLAKGKDGFIYSITLERFENYYQEKPFLKTVTFKFYQSEEELLNAYGKKEILGISKAPDNYKKGMQNVEDANDFKIKLPQYFAIFFNQESNKILKEKNIRTALAAAVDKDSLINQTFTNNAERLDSCIPFSKNDTYKKINFSLDETKTMLEVAGWKDADGDNIRDKASVKLEFSLATADQPQLIKLAELIKSMWENIGVKVNLNIKSISDLQNNVIRNRDYDMLIFGQSLEEDPDPYAFWHSSQKNYPGLNLAMFSNPEADKILEAIRKEFDPAIKTDYYSHLENIITEEAPAIFLFSLNREYLINKKIQGVEIGNISTAPSRFSKINKWYIKTKYERRN